MRTLYYHPICPYSRKIRFILSEKKLDYSLKIEPFWEKRQIFFELNPALTVPVLIDINNTVVPDSYAIQEYIEEMYPEPKLLDADPKVNAEIRRLTAWFDTKFAADVTLPIIYEKIFKRYSQTQEAPNSKRIRDAKHNIIVHLEYIGWLIERRNWLAGNNFSLADIAASAHLSAVDYFGDVPWHVSKDAKQWYMKVKSRPTFQVLLRDRAPGIQPAPHFKVLDF